MISSQQALALLAGLRARQAEMVRLLEKFVRAESPTDAKSQVDRFARVVAAEWRRRGAGVAVLRQRDAGNHLRIVWPASRAPQRRGQILVLGHMDTVYAQGTLCTMPWQECQSRGAPPGRSPSQRCDGPEPTLSYAAAASRPPPAPPAPLVILWAR